MDRRTDGRTDRRTDNVKTVYPLQTKFAGGITRTKFALDRHTFNYDKLKQGKKTIKVTDNTVLHNVCTPKVNV